MMLETAWRTTQNMGRFTLLTLLMLAVRDSFPTERRNTRTWFQLLD